MYLYPSFSLDYDISAYNIIKKEEREKRKRWIKWKEEAVRQDDKSYPIDTLHLACNIQTQLSIVLEYQGSNNSLQSCLVALGKRSR